MNTNDSKKEYVEIILIDGKMGWIQTESIWFIK